MFYHIAFYHKTKVKHPLEHRNPQQVAYLAIRAASQVARRFHGLMYSYGNAIGRYDEEIRNTPRSKQDDEEWLEGLHPAIAKERFTQSIEVCLHEPGFSRFMRHKRLPGPQAYVREPMGPADCAAYKAMTEGVDN